MRAAIPQQDEGELRLLESRSPQNPRHDGEICRIPATLVAPREVGVEAGGFDFRKLDVKPERDSLAYPAALAEG